MTPLYYEVVGEAGIFRSVESPVELEAHKIEMCFVSIFS
jgi:hypothetical protein